MEGLWPRRGYGRFDQRLNTPLSPNNVVVLGKIRSPSSQISKL